MIGEILALTFAEGVSVTSGTASPTGLSQNIPVTFTAELTKNVDTSAYGIDAENVIAQLYDSTNHLVEIDIDSSDGDTLVLTAGTALTGTFQLRIIEVTA